MYTELQITSNFSFLRGAAHPEELVQYAKALGYDTLAITDRNTLAGVVRAHAAGRKHGLRVIPGCRLDLLDGPSLLALPQNREGWGRLCSLLSLGNSRTGKGDCHLYKEDVAAHAGGLHFIVLPPEALNAEFRFEEGFEKDLYFYKAAFGGHLSLAATRRYGGDDAKQLHRLAQLSSAAGVPLVATNDVHYHEPQRRQLQDVLTCIRERCTIHGAGYRLLANAERYLKPAHEMARLFMHYPEALERSAAIAAECRFSLDELKYDYPEEITTEGRTPQAELEHLAWKGAHETFGSPLPPKTEAAVRYELAFIARVNYAAYFLTVYDIVRFARSRGILCQGRGSAANSTVCFCLGITSVNPEQFELLFERFLSDARNEPPDIDVDFEHERREEVIQYIYNKYGRDRAAIVATVTQQHQKGAVRDVGKAMGLTGDTIKLLSGSVWDYEGEVFEEERIVALGMNPKDPHLRKVLELVRQYIGFPRQLGQHTGGFVITRGKLTELCPVLNARMPGRTCIEWNKDDIETLGFLKIDVLALGMLTCIRKAFDLARQHYGMDLTLANIPQEDPEVYDMICRADTVGVFQIESRAQQSMLPRLRPRAFYDLVIEVAIVRPGPIQGDMVHPYLRRRNGEEPVTYPTKELEEILKRTLGVPLFQEQAMKIAIVAAGFTPTEADGLRRSMATFKFKGVVSEWRDKLVSGMMQKGYTREYAGRVFRQLEGFGSYGFPESHAASFALLVWVSSWLKCHLPEVFSCALLNSLPMGFYQPAQLVQDARNHAVEVLAVDVNYSEWDCRMEPGPRAGKYSLLNIQRSMFKGAPLNIEYCSLNSEHSPKETKEGAPPRGAGEYSLLNTQRSMFKEAPLNIEYCSLNSEHSPKGTKEGLGLRLGFRLIKGFREEDARLLVEKRTRPYSCINDLRDAGLSDAALERLADADAFRSLGLDRRAALWEVRTKDRPEALFEGSTAPDAVGESVQLPLLLPSEHVVQDYGTTGLSLKAHPVSFVRAELDRLGACRARDLALRQHGDAVKVAGLVLVRQRPGTARGVWFMTIEDETGTANLVLFPQVVEAYRRNIVGASLFMAEGTVQREGLVIHVILRAGYDLSPLLRRLVPSDAVDPDVSTLSRADEREGSGPLFPNSRDFR
ncbi:MAG: DNA polymerase III subunit alpha [Chitinophagaceae bacterium]|nr:MAG: DNA polymerase III subunit alpha [Chitinophagaceae bacterium]